MNEPHQALSEPIEPALTGRMYLREVDKRRGGPVPSICAELREARLEAGYDLPDVANALRIQRAYLEALEEGRFDDLPGTTYAVGFLRSYAGFLGLDADKIVGAYKDERVLDAEQQRLAFPTPTKETPRPRLWLILIALVLAGLAYGGWQYYASEGRIATDLVADVSSRLTVAAGLGGNEEPAVAPEEGSVDTPPAAVEPAVEIDVESVAAAPPEPAETSVAAPRRLPVVEARTLPAPAETPAATPPIGDTVGAAGQEEAAAVTPPVPDGAPVESTRALAAAPIEGGAAAGAGARDAAPLPEATESSTGEPGSTSTGAPDNTTAGDDRRPAVARLGGAAPAAIAAQPTGMPPPSGPASGYPALEAAQTPARAEPSEAAEAVETVALVEPAAPDATPRGEEQTTRADPAAAPAYVPRVFGRGNLDSRVVITALADSWVQIQGPDNELLLTRILRPGDSYRVPDRPDLVMVTGNAGGLEIRVDDALAPALGPVGVVRRNIALAPDSLLAGGVGN